MCKQSITFAHCHRDGSIHRHSPKSSLEEPLLRKESDDIIEEKKEEKKKSQEDQK